MMSEWLDDDKVLVAPPPGTEVPPHNTRTEEHSKEREGFPEQRAKRVPEQWVREVLERQAERPTANTAKPPPHATLVDPKAKPRGSGRHHQFKKVYR